jgi:hypothetical protein
MELQVAHANYRTVDVLIVCSFVILSVIQERERMG